MCDIDVNQDLGEAQVPDAGAVVRPAPVLLDALDLYYRLHWACRQASLDGGDPPAGILMSVVGERRRALEWVIDREVEWDNVPIDT